MIGRIMICVFSITVSVFTCFAKNCPNGLSVTVSGGDVKPLTDSIFTCAATPAGGTYTWTCSDGMLLLPGESGSSVTFASQATASDPLNMNDQFVQCKYTLNGKDCTHKLKMSIIIPKGINSNHPTYSGPATVGRTSGASNVPGYVVLWYSYTTYLTVRVDDQSGRKLGDCYNGVTVSESGSHNGDVGNLSSGEYADPVGVLLSFGAVPAEDPIGTPNPAIATFLEGSGAPGLGSTPVETQTITVYVDGYTLDPGVAGRTVRGTGYGNIEITWP